MVSREVCGTLPLLISPSILTPSIPTPSLFTDFHLMLNYCFSIPIQDRFIVHQYLDHQPDISASMRTILVDWLIEVQENFELFHETLYLAVKLVDLYLQKKVVKREYLQLVGATSMLIASKFEVNRMSVNKHVNVSLCARVLNGSIYGLFSFLPHRNLVRLLSMIFCTCVTMRIPEKSCLKWRQI